MRRSDELCVGESPLASIGIIVGRGGTESHERRMHRENLMKDYRRVVCAERKSSGLQDSVRGRKSQSLKNLP
jgi:hypothetical protein